MRLLIFPAAEHDDFFLHPRGIALSRLVWARAPSQVNTKRREPLGPVQSTANRLLLGEVYSSAMSRCRPSDFTVIGPRVSTSPRGVDGRHQRLAAPNPGSSAFDVARAARLARLSPGAWLYDPKMYSGLPE